MSDRRQKIEEIVTGDRRDRSRRERKDKTETETEKIEEIDRRQERNEYQKRSVKERNIREKEWEVLSE